MAMAQNCTRAAIPAEIRRPWIIWRLYLHKGPGSAPRAGPHNVLDVIPRPQFFSFSSGGSLLAGDGGNERAHRPGCTGGRNPLVVIVRKAALKIGLEFG